MIKKYIPKLSKFTFLLVVVASLIGVYQVNKVQHEQEQLIKKIDSRFKAYDFFLVWDHVSISPDGKKCVNLTHAQIRDYYSEEGRALTPLAKKLLTSNLQCKRGKNESKTHK